MKKTINVNIGGTAFILDEDAYGALKRYLEEIEIRLNGFEDKEILEDIEVRISDIFTENLSSRIQVVDTYLVGRAVSIIGEASEFGEPLRSLSHNSSSDHPETTLIKRHYRSRSDKLLGGVCGGIAQYYDLDPLIVRIVTILVTVFTGVPLILYVVLWIIMPLEPFEILSGTTITKQPNQISRRS